MNPFRHPPGHLSTLRRQVHLGLKTWPLLLWSLATATASAQSWVAGSPPNDATATNYFPYLATTTLNVSYGALASQVGDIWVPNYNGKAPPTWGTNSRPAIVVVHGGGGTSGSRSSTRENQISGFCAAHGYVAFNVDYPLGTVYPQNVTSWRLAVRYLRAHAAQYGVDPNHIGITGGSFGGYCSAFMSGITNGQKTIWPDSDAKYNNVSLDVDGAGDLAAYSGNVQCGIDLYGPADQVTSGNALGQYGSGYTQTTLSNSSPIYYVHATSAPLLVAHGTADTTVDISQSEELTNYLGRFAVPHQFCIVTNAAHTFQYYQSSGGQWPPGNSVLDLRATAFDWFDKWLVAAANPPLIAIQPATQSGCVGYPARFSVTANGTAPLGYQWIGPAGAIAGANTATYTIASLDSTNAGNYLVVITNNYGSVTSGVVALSVTSLTPPSITTDVADGAVLAGNPASFTVVATGDALQYQWFGPIGAIANATNSTYTIASAGDADAGSYQVIIYNSCDSLPSRNATLTVNGPPSISDQPAWGSSTNCSGTPDTAIAIAIGTAPLSYQWYGPAGAIAGANTNTLTLTNPAVGDTGNYYLVVTNSYGSATGSNAYLTVSANSTLTITADATGFTANAGATATFSVTVAGSGSLNYLWLKNDYDTISNNASSTTATLVLTNVQPADSGTYYHCLIANDCSVIGSGNGVLTVIGGGTNVTTNFTGNGTWTCPAGVTSVQVQCWGGGGGGGGATSSAGRAGGGGAGGNYVSATLTVTTANLYTVTAGAGGGGGATSSAGCNGTNGFTSSFAGSGITTLSAGGGAGGLGAQTSNAGAGAGGAGASTGNAGPIGFVGYAGGSGGNGVLSTGTGGGGGAAGGSGNGTNAVGILAGGGATGGGNGAAGVTATATGNPGGTPGGGGSGGYGSAKAGGAGGPGKVTIGYSTGNATGTAPTIFGQTSGVTNASGNGFSLQVTAGGSLPLTYQWYDGVSPIGGQTGATYNLNSPATTDSGNYSVVITNAYGSLTSSVATVLITNAAPFVTAQPQPQSVSAGATATFSVAVGGSLPLSYQWFRGGSPISGATGGTYSLSGVTTNDSGGSFAVVITNAYGAVTSSVVNLTVTAVVSAGGVVIDEVYAGGGKSGATYKNDYVVLKNVSSSTVSINGWSLQHDKLGVWQTPFALPSASIPAGGYYLIQCYNDGSSGTNGAALPAPDATATQSSVWNMSYASADAVALVNTTNAIIASGVAGSLSASATAAAGIVDLVGESTSTANDYLGSGVATGGSAANAVTRKNGGCQNTLDNSLDFVAAPANPKNSATTPAPCGGQPPIAATLTATGVTASAAVLNGTVNPSGAATTWYFQYGTTTNYGSHTATNTLSADTNSVSVSSSLSGLTAGTGYHCQLVADNGGGNGSGGDMALTTLAVMSPQLAVPRVLSNGSARFSFAGTPGATFTILGTTDLTLPIGRWPTLGVATEDPAGQYNFTDPQATTNSLRFYEVRSP